MRCVSSLSFVLFLFRYRRVIYSMRLLDVRVLRVHFVDFGRSPVLPVQLCCTLRSRVGLIAWSPTFERSPALKSGTAAREERGVVWGGSTQCTLSGLSSA